MTVTELITHLTVMPGDAVVVYDTEDWGLVEVSGVVAHESEYYCEGKMLRGEQEGKVVVVG